MAVPLIMSWLRLCKDDKSSIKLEGAHSGYKRAPLVVPKFSGELRHWHSFWNGFQQAVHNAADLSKPAKLSYLREAMKDEDLYEMLNRFSNDEGCYDQAVQELQNMFDKPRQMHQIYLSNLTTMGPVKCTQRALTTYANTLVQSRNGLVRLRQYDGKYILTSLVVGFLPDKVRMAWEDATDDSKTVPTVDELIAFVRKKAANPLYADRDEVSSPSTDRRPPTQQSKPKGAAHVAVSQQSAPPPEVQQSYHSPAGSRGPSHRPRSPVHPTSRYNCPLCSETHYPFACSVYRKMTVAKRKEHVRAHSRCSVCLKPGHDSEECRSGLTCHVCGARHNALVHTDTSGPLLQSLALPTCWQATPLAVLEGTSC